MYYQLLLLLALLLPLTSNAEQHISQSLCDDVAETLNDPAFADILTQHAKDHVLSNCYRNANE
jgi:hypothetical protein